MRAHRVGSFAAVLALIATSVVSLVVASPAGAAVPGQIVITEWMYNPQLSASEFVEVTNIGGEPVDMTNYSFDDDSHIPGTFSLAALGDAGPRRVRPDRRGPALTAVADFRPEWGLADSVKIAGPNTNNLGRNDEINIFNGSALVDRLDYGDQNFVAPPSASIRTQGISGVPTACVDARREQRARVGLLGGG